MKQRKVVILLVEYDPSLAQALSVVFEPEGYEVIQQASYAEALRLLPTIQVDAAFVHYRSIEADDLANGMEIIRTARKLHPKLPVIVTTAAGRQDVVVKLFKAGATHFWPMGSDLDELLVTIKRALAGEIDSPPTL